MNSRLSGLLNSILWGRRYINVKDAKDRERVFIAKELELEDKIWIDFIYKQALADGRAKGLIPSGELAVFLDRQGVWTKRDAKEIQNLKISLSKMEEKLKEDISKRERQYTLKLQDTLNKNLREKETNKNTYFTNSLETYASSQRADAAIFCYLYKDKDNKYWPRWENFLNETDSIFIKNALISIFDKKPMTIKEIREIARSGVWRIKWNAYKSSGNLFGKPLMKLTIDQESLVYWSQVYDAAFESLDRPSQAIIDDDAALDKWFEDQAKKRKVKEVESGKNDIGKIGTRNLWRHSEVGIITNPDAQADMNRSAKLGIAKSTYVPTTQEVNELNSPLARKFKQHQEKKIKRYGVIEETDLRSDANSRRAIGSSDAIVKRAKRKDGFTGKQVVKKMPGGTLQGRKE